MQFLLQINIGKDIFAYFNTLQYVRAIILVAEQLNRYNFCRTI